MVKLEIIADLQDVCGEGPLWDHRSSILYWVDITGEKIHQLHQATGAPKTFLPGVPVSGVAITGNADLIIAGGDGIWRWNSETGAIPIVREYEGERLAINDCLVDPHGRLLAGSAFYDGSDSYARGSLYSIDTDGSVRKLDTGFGLANGMGFSVDGKTLYVTDSVERRIYAYDYDCVYGTAANRRGFVQVSNDQGLPDGLTVDAENFVWSAEWFGSCLCRYDPDGKLERRVLLPAKQISSLTFGGPEFTDIFVTSAGFSDALPLSPAGYEATGEIGGALFHVNVGIRGKAEFICGLGVPR